jgi:hypothetical protein
MKLFFLIAILFFTSARNINALYCIHAIQPIDLSENLTLAAVQKAINNLTLHDGNDICFVEMQFSLTLKIIGVSFTALSNSSYIMVNREVQVVTVMLLSENYAFITPATVLNSLVFSCDYQDGCDRRFVLDQLEWLFKAKYDQLESSLRPFLIENNKEKGKKMQNYRNINQIIAIDLSCYVNF